jgi:hypothetical protein
MRIDYERKLTKQELDNLTKELSNHFTPASALQIFEYLMENGSFVWQKDGFTNKLGLLYKDHADMMLHKATNKLEDLTELKQMIDSEQGTDKHYFLFINYHKAPQMWRLEDMKLIWGVGVHESYGNMQNEYFSKFREKKAEEKLEKINEIYSKYAEV